MLDTRFGKDLDLDLYLLSQHLENLRQRPSMVQQVKVGQIPLSSQKPSISFRANPANYRNNPRGNFVGDAALTAAELGGAAHGKYLNAVDPLIRDTTYSAGKGARGVAKALGAKPKVAASAGRMAMQALKNPAMKVSMRYLPVAGTALSVGDLILGDESLANKSMDATLMAAGAALGSVVPVVGTAIGVGGGKLISDGIQYLFGDRKSPEERRMEEALRALQQGRIG